MFLFTYFINLPDGCRGGFVWATSAIDARRRLGKFDAALVQLLDDWRVEGPDVLNSKDAPPKPSPEPQWVGWKGQDLAAAAASPSPAI